uniref:Uncharacterized protein n=1 Tax=Rhizophora mucronata TaxID=61149 RepID=A0A2P2N6X0_RHIMU
MSFVIIRIKVILPTFTTRYASK